MRCRDNQAALALWNQQRLPPEHAEGRFDKLSAVNSKIIMDDV